MGNSNILEAKLNRNDEFYTLYKDIEKELKYYKPQFKNKVVYCNCDNPKHFKGLDFGSQFWNYFYLNFEHLGLNKLIATYFNNKETVFKYEYDGVEITKTELKGNGDFRNEENIKILKKVDVVVTNPPFSLFREFIMQLIEYNKDFLIVGNFNSVTYKEIFPLIREGKILLGYNTPKKFIQPNGSIKQVFTTWFTTFQVNNYKPFLKLSKTYTSKDYLEYDNYKAIDVSRVIDIPKDYVGPMGVPITFLTKYNPKQFEILNANDYIKENSNINKKKHGLIKDNHSSVNGKNKYVRILIRNRKPKI